MGHLYRGAIYTGGHLYRGPFIRGAVGALCASGWQPGPLLRARGMHARTLCHSYVCDSTLKVAKVRRTSANSHVHFSQLVRPLQPTRTPATPRSSWLEYVCERAGGARTPLRVPVARAASGWRLREAGGRGRLAASQQDGQAMRRHVCAASGMQARAHVHERAGAGDAPACVRIRASGMHARALGRLSAGRAGNAVACVRVASGMYARARARGLAASS
jgi:hypothetical protein